MWLAWVAEPKLARGPPERSRARFRSNQRVPSPSVAPGRDALAAHEAMGWCVAASTNDPDRPTRNKTMILSLHEILKLESPEGPAEGMLDVHC
jgi:hypothetical protein